jgi:hypothetical protein
MFVALYDLCRVSVRTLCFEKKLHNSERDSLKRLNYVHVAQ